MPVLIDHCTSYCWIYDNLMHIFSQGEWFYASWLFSGQKRSAKQNYPLRKPGRKLHLFNTVRDLSLPAHWPWPFPCPGLSTCWLPLPGWELLIREANSPESLWEQRVEATSSLGYILKGKEAFTLESSASFLQGTLLGGNEAWVWAARGVAFFVFIFLSTRAHTQDLVSVVEVQK